jgi:bifunctional non-homologous end joining protein LigD
VVTPFSVRRRPKAPVSTPLDWSEVTPKLDPTTFNLENFSERLRRPDPWADFFRVRQSINAAAKSLGKV